jgi:hypothetical protein
MIIENGGTLQGGTLIIIIGNYLSIAEPQLSESSLLETGKMKPGLSVR